MSVSFAAVNIGERTFAACHMQTGSARPLSDVVFSRKDGVFMKVIFSLVPKTVLLSWGCTLAILILGYRYTLKLDCHEFGCQTDFDVVVFGLPLFIVQLVLSPLAARSLSKKIGHKLHDQMEHGITLASALIAAPPILSIIGSYVAVTYTSYRLLHG